MISAHTGAEFNQVSIYNIFRIEKNKMKYYNIKNTKQIQRNLKWLIEAYFVISDK